MRGLLNYYRAHFKVALAVMFQYRAAVIIWLIGMILEPVIYLVVWSTVARASGGSIGGYSPGDFAAYYIVFMMVNHATFIWHMWEFEWRIRSGTFSPMLLRPIHPIHNDVADSLAYKTLTLSVMIPTAIIMALLFQPTFHTPLWAVPAFFVALVLAVAVRFLVEWTLALAVFWTTRIQAVNGVYFMFWLFLGGTIAPIALLPGPLQTLAAVLPFRWFTAFPVELLLGRLTPEETLTGYAMQGLWLVIAYGLVQLAWRVGVRRYTAVGG